MLGKTLRDLYTGTLRDEMASVRMRTQVLRNLHHYMMEEESRMIKAEEECKSHHHPFSSSLNNSVCLC